MLHRRSKRPSGSSPAAPRNPARSTAQPAGLLGLQREAGNRAVADLVGGPAGPPLAQRFVGGLFEDVSEAVGGFTEAAAGLAGGVADTATGVAKGFIGTAGGLQDISYGLPAEQALVKRLILSGLRDPDKLTRIVFTTRHPATAFRDLDPKSAADKPLIKEWQELRKELVGPSLRRYVVPTELTEAEEARKIRAAAKQALKGGEADARTKLAADIRATAKKSVEEWFADHVPGATFLGLRIHASRGGSVGGVHRNLLNKLEAAEAILTKEPSLAGLRGIDLADALGVKSIGGLRPPLAATGGERPSLHSYGLAIDIDAAGNPFVGLNSTKAPKMIERATLLVSHQEFKISQPPGEGRGAGIQWALFEAASDDVKTYLGANAEILELLVEQLASNRPDLPARQRTLSWWKERQKEDRALKGKGDFGGGRNPRTQGFMNLDGRLVRALAAAGLVWGGMYKGAKDIMHFDDRSLFRRKKPGDADEE